MLIASRLHFLGVRRMGDRWADWDGILMSMMRRLDHMGIYEIHLLHSA